MKIPGIIGYHYGTCIIRKCKVLKGLYCSEKGLFFWSMHSKISVFVLMYAFWYPTSPELLMSSSRMNEQTQESITWIKHFSGFASFHSVCPNTSVKRLDTHTHKNDSFASSRKMLQGLIWLQLKMFILHRANGVSFFFLEGQL